MICELLVIRQLLQNSYLFAVYAQCGVNSAALTQNANPVYNWDPSFSTNKFMSAYSTSRTVIYRTITLVPAATEAVSQQARHCRAAARATGTRWTHLRASRAGKPRRSRRSPPPPPARRADRWEAAGADRTDLRRAGGTAVTTGHCSAVVGYRAWEATVVGYRSRERSRKVKGYAQGTVTGQVTVTVSHGSGNGHSQSRVR